MGAALLARSARDRAVLCAAGALAVGVPLAAWHHVEGRCRELETALGATAGAAVEIGGLEATLTGAVRLSDVVVADALAADSIEASVSLSSLLAGDLGADEIRIDGPRLRLRIDADGDSNIARLLRRASARRAAPHSEGAAAAPPGPHRLRRIVVSGGDLVAEVALAGGLGAFTVEVGDVELHPQERGVRLVTGAVRVSGESGPWRVHGRFARAGADIDLLTAHLDRALAVGGTLTIDAGGAVIGLRHADLEHRVDGADSRLAATLDGAGSPQLAIVARRDGPSQIITVHGQLIPLAVLAPLAPPGVALADAVASGDIELTRDGAGAAIRLDAELTGLQLDHPRLATAPLALSGRAGLRARLHADGDGGKSLDIDELTWTSGTLHAAAHGRAELPAGALRPNRADLTLELARAPCQEVLYALPEPLRDHLLGLTLRGEVAARMHLRWDLEADVAADVVALTADVDAKRCKVIEDAVAADPARLRSSFAHAFPDGTQALIGVGHGDWVSLAELPSFVPGAFVAAEDARFFQHDGFDLVQIGRSLGINLAAGDLLRGGSTISQQLVKNAFLSTRRDLARKLQEAVLTWRLEAVLDKRTILERYLNIIELGPGTYGVGAAAQRWFGKPAAELTIAETAFLAAITPEPTRMSKRIAAANGLDPRSRERVQVILRAMKRGGVIDVEEYERAKKSELRLQIARLAGL